MIETCSGCPEATGKRNDTWERRPVRPASALMRETAIAVSPCLDFGDCVKACQFDAIAIRLMVLQKIDNSKCAGCSADVPPHVRKD